VTVVLATTTTPPVPDWLARRGGALQPGVGPETTFLMIGGEPLYRLDVLPAAGKFACAVTNTVNGKRLDDPTKTSPSPEAALVAGLEQLRDALGW
jgi:hypothetical protein